MEWSPDGRLFVSEKSGALRIVKNGQLLGQPFMRLSVNTQSERGLIGVAFDPQFATNRYIYAFYTTSAGINRVSRFTASATNPDVVEPNSERVLLDNIPADPGEHIGGGVHFGGDGKLYISVGDSGTGANSQDLTTLAGKMLRINRDGSIPSDNPFVGQAGRRAEVWAYGLRNPYTFAFKPGTSTLFINDVGNNSWEEIDRGIAGANYGWPVCEGPCGKPGMVDPIYAYDHSSGHRAITGAVFYVAHNFPADYSGDFFFGDYVAGFINRYDPTTGQASSFATGIPSPADLRVGPDGALYYLSVEAKMIGRIAYTSTQPTPTPTPSTLAADAFSRSTAGGWGTADVGGQWTTSGYSASTSVNGAQGIFALTGARAVAAAILRNSTAANVDIRTRIRISARPALAPVYVYLVARGSATSEYRPKLLFEPNGSLAVHIGVLLNGSESSLTAPVTVPGITYATGSFYWLRAQLTGSNPTTIRVRAWADGSPEPSAWQLTITDSHAPLQTGGNLGIRAYISSRSSSGAITLGFDDYRVETAP